MTKNSDVKQVIYMPAYGLQGERIPFYILWENTQKIGIRIKVPHGVTLKELYNIDPNGFTIENSDIIVKDVEVNGYLGGVFESRMYELSSLIKTICFFIQEGTKAKEYKYQIELFRPDIKIISYPDKIIIKTGKNDKMLLDKTVQIYNAGKGTGILKVNVLSDSDIKHGTPGGYEEFVNNFLRDMSNNLKGLIEKYPQNTELISSFENIAKDPLPITKERLQKVKDVLNKLEEEFNNNEGFFRDFTKAILLAYLRNISLSTDFDAFLSYLRSIGNKKVILIDALRIVKVSTKPQKLIAELIITDLVRNKYEPIRLPEIILQSDSTRFVPIYDIFKIVSGRS